MFKESEQEEIGYECEVCWDLYKSMQCIGRNKKPEEDLIERTYEQEAI